MTHTKIISFTALGAKTSFKIAQNIPDLRVEQYARAIDPSLCHTSLKRMVQQAMLDCDLIIFIGSTGIAVRICAPYLRGKQYDPAVIVIDEQAKFVISLLSGHLGGANDFAKRIAQAIGAQPVITTATDGRHVFAIDSWAVAHDSVVYNVENIKLISGALLAGKPVGLFSDFPVDGQYPDGITTDTTEIGIAITYRPYHNTQFINTLFIIPRVIHIGIGCRRGTPESIIERAVLQTLNTLSIPLEAVRQVASIDIKQDEPGLCAFCHRHNISFVVYSITQLAQAQGTFTPSDFVQRTIGIDNVCERAAICSSQNGTLICQKKKYQGVTVAIALQNWRVQF